VFYNQFFLDTLSLEENLELYFIQFEEESFRLIDLKKIFCIKIIINPIPNSIADRTKKKKVREITLELSKKQPIESTIT